MIVEHCKVEQQFSLDGQEQLEKILWNLTNAWKVTINNFKPDNEVMAKNQFRFNLFTESKNGLKAILSNNMVMLFGQILQGSTSKMLHDVLEANYFTSDQQFQLIKNLLEQAGEFFTCNFDNLF